MNKLRGSSPINKGYTLIEILIALSITALVFGLGYVGYRDFSRRQLVNATAQTLVADLRLAQEQALSGQKVGSCVVLDGYKFDLSANAYTVSAACSDTDYLIKTVMIPSQIKVTPPTTNPIIFKVLGQGTNLPDGTTVSIIIAEPTINYSITTTVGSGGDIH